MNRKLSKQSATRVLFVVNRAEFFLSHRLPVAEALRKHGIEVYVATPPSKDIRKIEAAGYYWRPLSLEGKSLNPVSELRTVFALYRLYREVSPDLVHHVALKAVLYGGIAARLAGVPAVVSAVTGLGHVFSADNIKIRIARCITLGLSRFAFGHSNIRVIFQNTDNMDEFVARGGLEPYKAVLIKGSGVDVEHFMPGPEQEGRPIVLFASRMVWQKGVGEFVEAARQLIQEGIGARFVLAGDTDLLNPDAVPTKQLQAWDAEEGIEWWGFQENMASVFQHIHVVCLPSYYREGVPKVLIEAAASGRPIVTTDMPGCRDIVSDEVNGLLVSPRDSDALAEALRKLILDSKMRRQMGQEGRKLVEAEFSLKRVVEETLDTYDQLL